MAQVIAAVFTTVASAAGSAASTVGSAVSSVGSTLFSAGSTAASAAGSAASGASGAGSFLSSLFGSSGAGASGGGSFLSSLLQGTSTIGSALMKIQAGNEQSAEYAAQANAALGDSQLAEASGADKNRSLKAAMMDALAQQDISAAAGGVDASFGTPAAARRALERDGERALGINRANTDMKIARLVDRAASFRQMASRAKGQARQAALLDLVKFGADMTERG